MALFPYRPPLLRQPSHLARINPRHWLARDLVFAHSGLGAFIYGRPEQVNNPLSSAAIGGTHNPSLTNAFGFVPDGTNAVDYSLPLAVSQPLTLSAWAIHSYGDGYEPLLSVRRGLGNNGGARLAKGFPANGATATTYNTSGSFNSATASFNTAASVWMHYCGVFASNTDRRVFIQGGAKGTSTGSMAFPTDCTLVSVARAPVSANTVVTSSVYGIGVPLVIARILDDAEIARLHEEQRRNPWSLFTERPIWVPVSSGGGSGFNAAWARQRSAILGAGMR